MNLIIKFRMIRMAKLFEHDNYAKVVKIAEKMTDSQLYSMDALTSGDFNDLNNLALSFLLGEN